MFEGIKNFFSGKSEQPRPEETIDDASKESLRLDAFSKLFPEVTFTGETIGTLIQMAAITDDEVDNIMSINAIGEPQDLGFDLESVRDRLIIAKNTLSV